MASEKRSFSNYTPFKSSIHSCYVHVQPIEVLGVGDVPLKLKRPETASPPHSTIVLHNVVHAPDVACKIVSPQLLAQQEKYDAQLRKGVLVECETGTELGIVDVGVLCKLRIIE